MLFIKFLFLSIIIVTFGSVLLSNKYRFIQTLGVFSYGASFLFLCLAIGSFLRFCVYGAAEAKMISDHIAINMMETYRVEENVNMIKETMEESKQLQSLFEDFKGYF